MDFSTLPFLTRKMLSFEQGASLGLEISSVASVAQPIAIRGFTRDGTFSLTHIPSSDRSGDIEDFRMPDIPTMICVDDKNDAIQQGEVFVALYLTVNGDRVLQLCNGWVYTKKTLSWPFSNNAEMHPNAGVIKFVSGTDPAAGAEPNITVPNSANWRLLAATVNLVTDGTVANRRVHLVYNSGANVEVNVFPSVDQTASLTRKYNFAPYQTIPDETDDNDILVSIPRDIIMVEGDTLDTVTTNLAAGDNFGPISVIVEEFFRF